MRSGVCILVTHGTVAPGQLGRTAEAGDPAAIERLTSAGVDQALLMLPASSPADVEVAADEAVEIVRRARDLAG